MIRFEEFAGRAKAILGNPQANPKAALMLLAMVSIFVVILILLGFIFYSLTKKEEAIKMKKAFSLNKAFAILALTGVSFLAFSYVGYQYSSKSTFCSNCHIMQSSIQSWQVSTHKKTACVKCHEKRQYFGGFIFLINFASELVANQNMPVNQKLASSVSNNNCVNCHSDIFGKTKIYKGLKVHHSRLDESFNCTDCHYNGHKKKNPRLVEQLCLSCHKNKKKENKCTYCHTKDIGKHITTPSRDFKKVQYAGLKTCRGCHSMNICIRCHQLELPHPKDWANPNQPNPTVNFHAKYAVFEGKQKICSKCHGIPAFCNRCHIFPNHINWKTEHQKGSAQTCTKVCHRTKAFCGLCHTGR